MNNFRSKVLIFCGATLFILFTASYFSQEIIGFYPNFKAINIISDIIQRPISKIKITSPRKILSVRTNPHFINTFEQYDTLENTIIKFDQYNDDVAMADFQNKLTALAKRKKGKIRIAWFGDSTIECDLITQQLRGMFSTYFDVSTAVGFMPLYTATSNLRKTGSIDFVGNLESYNFKENPQNLFLSGYSYSATDLDLTVTNNVKKKPLVSLDKWLYCGPGDSLLIESNEKIIAFKPTKYFNKILLDSTASNSIHFKIKNNSTPVFGISIEPENGIIIDNFSFRGITEVELRKIQNQLLDEINAASTYDLIIFQYGVNLLYSPELNNFDNYYSKMSHVLQKLKTHLSKSEFLIIGSADRAFKYDGEWKTAIGMDSLIKVQAKLAYTNKIPFLNLYKSMGGKGTIVKWADTIPSLANKDYIHFNYKGANKVANIIFNSFINDYNKLKSKSKKTTK